MPIIIQKFGGKLLENPDQIRRAADYIIRTKDSGENPVAVVSAPGQTTDLFTEIARQITDNPDEREMDMLLSVGERVAMSLLAMAINTDGRYHAVSFTGSQVGIITDTNHTDAHIIEVKCLRIRETLEKGDIPIIGGFQGVSTDKEITTLGRGGSDATAVALATALGAVRCELVKESGAVYSADPELVPEAVYHSEIDYNTLETLTSAGAQIVQPRASSLGRQHDVPLTITSVESSRGTLVTDRNMEVGSVAAVVIDENLSLITGDTVDAVTNDQSYIRFAINDNNAKYIVLTNSIGCDNALPVTLLTIVGWGGNINSKVVKTSLNALSIAGISPIAWSVSGGAFSLLIDSDEGRDALKVVHNACLKNELIKS
ncbi:MAG: aspartate kinase [Candidatus Hatepunaea meridiana]|nr:aspartate kinase [Candidatus Hatepunaea meridiana]